MTPAEYLAIKKADLAIIEAAEKRIEEARKAAHRCKPPKNRRPAWARDIVVGAVIWHERERRFGGDYWNVVEEVLYPGDAFKAYCADDGCRYGLEGAYVEVVP